MASWDVFHADRLELERGQSAQAIRTALARGDLRDDDLIRPAGTTVPWARITDIPELLAPEPEPAPQPGPAVPGPSAEATRPEARLPDFEEIQPSLEQIIPPPKQHHPTELPGSSTSDVAFPVLDEPEPRPLQAPGTSLPSASSRAWVWADDDDDEKDEDELRIIEDQVDIEILADDALEELGAGPTAAAEQEPTAQTAVPGGSSDAGSRRVEAPTAAEPHDGWEPSAEDLDLDVAEASRPSRVALPVVPSRDRDGAVFPDDADDQPEAEFSLSRSSTQKIEELDLAPMVDVAFQLVLFFMVTATTVLYKTLEIPKPAGEAPAGAVAQGRSRSLDDLMKDDYILVEIDDRGAMKLDREPIEPVRETLVENLRRAREKTGRKSMLLAADAATLHRHAVLAYDAAHEIGLGIAIAKPRPLQGPAPTLRAAPAAVPKPAPDPTAAPAAPF